jgi:hypothetical protein
VLSDVITHHSSEATIAAETDDDVVVDPASEGVQGRHLLGLSKLCSTASKLSP